jgi:hypothetical protein
LISGTDRVLARHRLHEVDPTSFELTLSNLIREPTIYLNPECDTDEDVAEVLWELCEGIFEEQLAGWYTDTSNLAARPAF